MPDGQAGRVTAGGTADTQIIHPDTTYTTISPGQSTSLNYGDTIVTGPGGKAREVLDDGRLLNVGADSQLQVLPHEPAIQRSWLEIIYGEFRAWMVRIANPGGGGGGGRFPGGPVGLIVISPDRGDISPFYYDDWME